MNNVTYAAAYRNANDQDLKERPTRLCDALPTVYRQVESSKFSPVPESILEAERASRGKPRPKYYPGLEEDTHIMRGIKKRKDLIDKRQKKLNRKTINQPVKKPWRAPATVSGISLEDLIKNEKQQRLRVPIGYHRKPARTRLQKQIVTLFSKGEKYRQKVYEIYNSYAERSYIEPIAQLETSDEIDILSCKDPRIVFKLSEHVRVKLIRVLEGEKEKRNVEKKLRTLNMHQRRKGLPLFKYYPGSTKVARRQTNAEKRQFKEALKGNLLTGKKDKLERARLKLEFAQNIEKRRRENALEAAAGLMGMGVNKYCAYMDHTKMMIDIDEELERESGSLDMRNLSPVTPATEINPAWFDIAGWTI
mgnify:CR=1 FL=1|jgi:hypothetical protein